MKKVIGLVVISIVAFPVVAQDREKSSSEKAIEDMDKDDITIVNSEPPDPPDPFEDFEQNKGVSKEALDKVKNMRASPFDEDAEAIPVLDHKPAKNGESLYEMLTYDEEVDVRLPPKVGESRPIQLNFEPNPANMDRIESFKIISLDGHVLEFDTFDRKTVNSDKDGLYVFKDLKSKGHNSVKVIYDADLSGKANYIALSVDHIKTGSFRASIDVRSKKGYIYKYKPHPSGTKYGSDVMTPEDYKKFK